MVNRFYTKEIEGVPPPRDEEWWATLLSEEERFSQSHLHGFSSSGEKKPEVSSVTVDWDLARQLHDDDEAIELEVTGYNRGGLLVEGDELQGFVPLSHLVSMPGDQPEDEREGLLAEYVGQLLRLKVIECDPERGRVVFSERAAKAAAGRRNQLLHTLSPGDKACGTVTNITDFGVFVDLGGVEGLIHVSELSWGRVRHPSDVVRLGDETEVYVINVDEERSRVALSLKRMFPNPWETAEQRYQPGMVVEATVTSILPFGAFARLEDGLDGLIHVSEMSVDGEPVRPMDIVIEGEKVLVRILQVEAKRQRLGLSLQVEADL